jgi:Lon protease-like protein
MDEIALFPLPRVVFPHAPLALHVFEERYRAMIDTCLRDQQSFAIVLVEASVTHSGELRDQQRMQHWLDQHPNYGDEYPNYLPHVVGTSIIIGEHLRLEDGRYLLRCEGHERIRITGITQRTPYLIATYEPWLSEPTAAARAAAIATHDIYQRYWRILDQIGGRDETHIVELAADPVDMSWQLADLLQIDMVRKQEWLCMTPALRLRSMIAAIRAELQTYPDRAPTHTAHSPWSWN